MQKIASSDTASTAACSADRDEASEFKPLTREEAQVWRSGQKPFSPWRVVVWQALAGSVSALLVWWFTGRVNALQSAAYGALAVVLPSVLWVRGMLRTMRPQRAGSGMAGLVFWELVKIALTIALLFAAPKVVPHLDWLALLAGFVVTMKAYWLTLTGSMRSKLVK
ncbi:MAG: ATP synthase subunit I [Macromonas sp.]